MVREKERNLTTKSHEGTRKGFLIRSLGDLGLEKTGRNNRAYILTMKNRLIVFVFILIFLVAIGIAVVFEVF